MLKGKEFLTNLVLLKEQHRNETAAEYLREMTSTEAIRKTFRRIKFVKKKIEQTATTYVTRPLGGGTVEEITNKDGLEKAIIKENIQKYHQTEDSCPLFEPQIYGDIRKYGDGPAVPDILLGMYSPPPGTSDPVNVFLTQMRKADSTHTL